MVPMQLTVEDLKKLPLRAIVAFAARCARRVQSLSQLPEDHPEEERHRAAVEAAIRMAESFARGSAGPAAESVVEAIDARRQAVSGLSRGDSAAAAAEAARAAVAAWDALDSRAGERDVPSWGWKTEAHQFLDRLSHTEADLAALSALTAAEEAVEAVGFHNEAIVAAIVRDHEKLLGLKLGSYPEAGEPIDPGPEGPLGPL